MIDQDSAHGLGRSFEELHPVLPVDVEPDELGVSLVNQRGGLQGVLCPFASHVVGGQTSELVVNQWQEGVDGPLLALAAIDEQLGHFPSRAVGHVS